MISGLLSLRTGNYDSAVAHYKRAIELEPKNAKAHSRLGSAYQSKGETELALAEHTQAVTIDPDNYMVWWDRGYLELDTGHYDAAAKDLLRSTQLAPSEPGPNADLAMAYSNLGRFAEAEGAARVAVERQRNGGTLFILGRILLYQNKQLQAIPYLKEAAETRPRAIHWQYLGVAYQGAAQPSAAVAAFQQAFKLAREESSRDYRDGVARARVALLAAMLGDKQMAGYEIDQALVFAPANSDARFLAAWTYEVLGLRDKSLGVLESAKLSVLDDLSRWPSVANLAQDPQFLRLLKRAN
jgi:tetratricopeptide (TPR) repeat protein